MTIKQRAPQMRHVARTHRIDLDFILERIKTDKSIRIRYVGTKEQIADILTKGMFTSEQWKSLCELLQIGASRKQVKQGTNHTISCATRYQSTRIEIEKPLKTGKHEICHIGLAM